MSTKVISTPSNSTTESPSVGCTPSSVTPVRHNYAASHTPIASAKRPRQPLTRAMTSNDAMSPVSTPSVKSMQLQNYTPVSASRQQDQQMSPMHPPRPVPVGAHGVTLPRSSAVSSSTETNTSPDSSNSNSSSSLGSSSWVGRKVDAIFSPVLNFLNGKNYQNHSNVAPHHDECKDDAFHPSTEDETVEMDDRNLMNDPNEACKLEQDSYNKITGCDAAERISTEKSSPECLDSSLSDASISVELETSSENEDASDQEDEFNPYFFIKSLPSYSLVVPDPCAKICLPPKRGSDPRISLVLDLDETLVHCTVEPVMDADMIFPVNFHGIDYTVYVRLRPYLKEFLEAIRGKYEVIIFTASQQAYADELLNRIDPREFVVYNVSILLEISPSYFTIF